MLGMRLHQYAPELLPARTHQSLSDRIIQVKYTSKPIGRAIGFRREIAAHDGAAIHRNEADGAVVAAVEHRIDNGLRQHRVGLLEQDAQRKRQGGGGLVRMRVQLQLQRLSRELHMDSFDAREDQEEDYRQATEQQAPELHSSASLLS